MKNILRSLVLVLALAVTAPVKAQTANINPGPSMVIAHATKPFAVPVVLDLSHATNPFGTITVASFQGTINWNVLARLDSIQVLPSLFSVYNPGAGTASWAAFNATALPAGRFATLFFTSTASLPGIQSGSLSLSFSVVGSEDGVNVTNHVRSLPVTIKILPCGC